MKKDRDSQQGKVYAAQVAAGLWKLDDRKFADVGEVQAYLDKLMAMKRIQARFPLCGDLPIECRMGNRPNATYWWSWRRIQFAPGMLREWVVLHEFAHHVTRTADQGHGWEFCEAFLWLLRFRLGQDAHDALRAAFKAGKVRYTKPRANTMTPEQKAEAAARLAAWRARRDAEIDASGERGEWVVCRAGGPPLFGRGANSKWGFDSYVIDPATADQWVLRSTAEKWAEKWRVRSPRLAAEISVMALADAKIAMKVYDEEKWLASRRVAQEAVRP